LAALRDPVSDYDNERYDDSLDSPTPAAVDFGRQYAVLSEPSKIERRIRQQGKQEVPSQQDDEGRRRGPYRSRKGLLFRIVSAIYISLVRAILDPGLNRPGIASPDPCSRD